jgi:hypothetical protein
MKHKHQITWSILDEKLPGWRGLLPAWEARGAISQPLKKPGTGRVIFPKGFVLPDRVDASGVSPAPPPKPLQAVPAEQWPSWAKWVKALATDADEGVGDTVKRLLLNGWLEKALKAAGVPCRCPALRAQWNTLYPY